MFNLTELVCMIYFNITFLFNKDVWKDDYVACPVIKVFSLLMSVVNDGQLCIATFISYPEHQPANHVCHERMVSMILGLPYLYLP